MRTEYEVWRDELAGKRRPLVGRVELTVFVLGLVALVAFGLTHR